MPVPYNLTGVTNASNIVELTQEVNQLTGEYLGLLILISFFVILIAAYRDQTPVTRVTVAAFLTTLISFLFRVIGMTGDLVVLIFVLITSGCFIIMYYQKDWWRYLHGT